MRETTIAGRYRLLAPLGRGGMGSVYDAVDERLERPVAVKVLLDELAREPELVARFHREAKLAASLTHPGVAQVHDAGTDGTTHFIVLERIEGRTLARALADERCFAPERAVRIACEVLEALDAAHAAGILHRDLKPGNVMLARDGRVKVIDFGIAGLKESAVYTRLTQTGVVVGTPHFMAPEQARALPLDARADLYAVGGLLFAMLTGERPFGGRHVGEVLRALQEERPPRVEALVPSTPRALADVVEQALEKDPARRPVSARAFVEALRAARRSARSANDAEGARRVAPTATLDAAPLPTASPPTPSSPRSLLASTHVLPRAERREDPWLRYLALGGALVVGGALLYGAIFALSAWLVSVLLRG